MKGGQQNPKLTYKLTNAGQTNEQLGQSNDINVLFAAFANHSFSSHSGYTRRGYY
ncbi:hypothetical protein CCAN11_2180005 [Capnocytophaga canimorsus]|uniref:Uncharacterized protein n=1 Tax=Capnocytophaga canimorsus TaxID=28188 RepID=A0A0B7IFF4_9FLAO|nr:hypothetical protein CCAN11_2180005 [Capnocytophaga canimorsus]